MPWIWLVSGRLQHGHVVCADIAATWSIDSTFGFAIAAIMLAPVTFLGHITSPAVAAMATMQTDQVCVALWHHSAHMAALMLHAIVDVLQL